MNGSLPNQDGVSVQVRGLRKAFDGQDVLRGLDFDVQPGEVFVIMGPSGSGKTVLLKHLIGLEEPDAGEILIEGQPIQSSDVLEQYRLAMVFQSGALFDSLTVGENVLFSLELREDYSAHNKEDVVNGLLKMVDILEARDAYPSDLSTGYRRAVAIARALAAQPQCILYDEPTTMVDPIMSDHLGDMMLRLKRELKLTAVVVTHDLDLMYKVADKVVFLFEGKVIYFGPTAEMEKSPHPHIQEFLEMDKVL